jgi:hypothetical protein
VDTPQIEGEGRGEEADREAVGEGKREWSGQARMGPQRAGDLAKAGPVFTATGVADQEQSENGGGKRQSAPDAQRQQGIVTTQQPAEWGSERDAEHHASPHHAHRPAAPLRGEHMGGQHQQDRERRDVGAALDEADREERREPHRRRERREAGRVEQQRQHQQQAPAAPAIGQGTRDRRCDERAEHVDRHEDRSGELAYGEALLNHLAKDRYGQRDRRHDGERENAQPCEPQAAVGGLRSG